MKFLVTDPLAPEAVDLLRKSVEVDVKKLTTEELLKAIGEYDGLLVRSETKVTRAVLEAGRRLKVVGRAGVGVDNIDVEAAKARGIAVVNSPLAASNAVAELTLGQMLAMARMLPQANASMHEGRWEKKAFKGAELSGKVLGLVGVGRIGGRVAELARAFGMSVVVYDPYVSAEKAREMDCEKKERVEDVVSISDYVSVHTPLTSETRHLIGADLLRRFKRGSRLVNAARGGIVDEAALAEALRSGHLAGAALDVFATEPLPADSPLLKLPNCHLTPHLGASTEEAQQKAGLGVVEQALKVIRGERAEFRVA